MSPGALKSNLIWSLFALATLTLTTACAREPEPPRHNAAEQATAPVATVLDSAYASADSQSKPRMIVHRSPTCGCCGLWVEHIQEAGFPVEVRETADLNPIKSRLGVPYGKNSCHTAEVDGYVIEGHVPAEDILRLLSERPKARGLVLPGMPLGSPGMEAPDGRVLSYTVELITEDGSTTAFRHVGDHH
jgi:hypothetical protein